MLTRYIVWDKLVALGKDDTLIEIPAGAVVEAPAMLVARGTVVVRHQDRLMTVLALDLLDSARVVPRDYE